MAIFKLGQDPVKSASVFSDQPEPDTVDSPEITPSSDFFTMMRKSKNAWDQAMVKSANGEIDTDAIEAELYPEANQPDPEKEAGFGMDILTSMAKAVGPSLATKVMESGANMFRDGISNQFTKRLMFDKAINVENKANAFTHALNTPETQKGLGGMFGNLVDSLSSGREEAMAEQAKEHLLNMLPENSGLRRSAEINDQLKVLGMDSKGYKSISDSLDRDVMSPLQKTQMENSIRNQSLEAQNMQNNLSKFPMEHQILNNNLHKQHLETQILQDELRKKNTLLSRMQSSTFGQISAPLLTGALVTGGAGIGAKLLSTLGTVNDLVGVGDPTAPLVTSLAIEKIYREKPELRSAPPELVKKYYKLILKYGHGIAGDPVTSATMIDKFINRYGGSDTAIIQDLLKTTQSMSDNRKQHMDIASLGRSLLPR